MDRPILTVPVAEPSEFNEPITMSPSATPVNPKLPVVASATLCAETVAEVNAAVPKLTAVSLGPLAPTWSVPVVPTPVLLIVVDAIVPIVAVPLDALMLVLNVATPVTPRLEDRVTAPVTPRLEDRVAAPVTLRLELKVAAPVTARLDARVVAPTELSVPLELTPEVEICSAETDDSSPEAIAVSVPVKGVFPDTFNN
jgi:hypothetical protein